MRKIIICASAALVFVCAFSCASGAKTAESAELGFRADLDPFDAGEYTANLEKTFVSGLKAVSGTLALYPRAGEAAITFSYQTNKNRLHLPYSARQAYIDAVKRYLSDFEEGLLDSSARKTSAVYGGGSGKLYWGPLQLNGEANVSIEYGYKFVGNAPYFTVRLPSAKNINPIYDSLDTKSLVTTLYFTKTQAENLAEMLTEEYIAERLAEFIIPEAEPDVYVPSAIDNANAR